MNESILYFRYDNPFSFPDTVFDLVLLFCATTLTQSAPVTVNFYGIHDEGNKKEADNFAIKSAFAHITTKSINLKLNSKAKQVHFFFFFSLVM